MNQPIPNKQKCKENCMKCGSDKVSVSMGKDLYCSKCAPQIYMLCGKCDKPCRISLSSTEENIKSNCCGAFIYTRMSQSPTPEVKDWEEDFRYWWNEATHEDGFTKEKKIDIEPVIMVIKDIIRTQISQAKEEAKKELVLKWENSIGNTRKLIDEAKEQATKEAVEEIEEWINNNTEISFMIDSRHLRRWLQSLKKGE